MQSFITVIIIIKFRDMINIKIRRGFKLRGRFVHCGSKPTGCVIYYGCQYYAAYTWSEFPTRKV